MSNVEHTGKISFTSFNKLQLSSHDSQRTCNNSAPLYGDFYTALPQTGQEMWKIQVKIHLCTEISLTATKPIFI